MAGIPGRPGSPGRPDGPKSPRHWSAPRSRWSRSLEAPHIPGAPRGAEVPRAAEVPRGAEVPRFDLGKNAREARDRVNGSLDQVEELLRRLEDKDIRSDVTEAVERVKREFNVLIEQGANASPSEILVVVMISKDPEDKVQESKAKASGADKVILDGIEKRLGDARVPFWTALASLGKVKEWSASLEISSGFFAVKGTGGISVTFGG